MQTPHTYRAQAEICVRQAEHAKTPQHRMTLLSMAQTWLRMASGRRLGQSVVACVQDAEGAAPRWELRP
jgi:hypothetical protein